jgi:hypothetical protein
VCVISSGTDVTTHSVHELGEKIREKLSLYALIIFGFEDKEIAGDEIRLPPVAGVFWPVYIMPGWLRGISILY